MHVAATQVERPGDVVEGSNEHAVSMLLAQGLANARYFLVAGFACQFQWLYANGILRDGRPTAPDLLQRVEIGAEGQSALRTEVGNEALHFSGSAYHAVDAHLCGGCVFQFLAKPLGNRRRAGNAFLHQLKACASQLFGGSDEVARVGPERRLVECDHGSTSRTVEAADPFATFPVVGHILTAVRVGTGEDKSTQVFAAHEVAEVVKTLGNLWVHGGED